MKSKNLTIIFLSLTIVALAVSNIFSWQKNLGNKNSIAELKDENEKLNEDYLTLEANLVSLNDLNVHLTNEVNIFRNPNFKTFILTSENSLFENSKVIVCWNKKDFSFMISAENLPKLEKDHFYQLWVMVNGKYDGKGFVFSTSLNGNFQKFESEISKVDGFILTIENSYDQPQPSLVKPYLAGNL